MVIRQTTPTRGLRLGLVLAIAASACLAAAPASAEEKPTPFKFEILPSDKTCLEILPEDDPKLKELKIKCEALMVKEKADCTRAGGTVLVSGGQTRCRKAGSSPQEYVAGRVKLPKGSPGPTIPVGASLGTKAVVGPVGGCVLRPGAPAPAPGTGCGQGR